MLRNKYGLHNRAALTQREYDATSKREVQRVIGQVQLPQTRDAAHLEAATAAMRAAADSSTGTSFKRMQQAILDQEGRIAKLTEAGRKDTGLNFEESGCDYLLIDEAHYFKNKLRPSGVAELACTPGAQQAEDLVMKLAVLRDQRRHRDLAEGRTPGPERVATFSTGTPVANSLGEMWVMQSYLRPDLLEAAGGGWHRRVGGGVHRHHHDGGDERHR